MSNFLISISTAAGFLSLAPSAQAIWNSAVSTIIRGLLAHEFPNATLDRLDFSVVSHHGGQALALARADFSDRMDFNLFRELELCADDVGVNEEGMVFNLVFVGQCFHGERVRLPFGELSVAPDGAYVWVHAGGGRQEGPLSDFV